MKVLPYLFFDGRCEEALAFYTEALGAQVQARMKYKESPDLANVKPEQAEMIMHGAMTIGESTVLLADGEGGGNPKFDGFSLALSAKDEAEARARFDALAAGGQVRMPLMATFFSPAFGIVADKFGVAWLIMVDQSSQS